MNILKKLITVILCITMLTVLPGGCADGALPASILPSPPTLELAGEYPCELPVITGAAWADDANDVISEALLPLTDALASANADRTVAGMAYKLQAADSSGYILSVYVSSASSGGRIRLVDISISPEGEVVIPEHTIPEYLTDGDWLNGYLRLSRYGLGLSLPDAGEPLTRAEICRFLVDYYESYTGSETDISALRLQSEDEYFLKSVALGLCQDTYDYDDDASGIYLVQYNTMTESLLERIFTDYLGRSSHYISDDDLLAAIELYFRLYFESPVNGTPRCIDTSGSDIPEPENADMLSRHEIALIFNAVYEHCFGGLTEPETDFFHDYSSNAIETSYHMSFIDSFPSYGLASIDFHPREYQLFSLVEYYVNTCWWMQPVGDDAPVDSRALISMLGWIDAYLNLFELPAGSTVTVDNSRNYQWYYSQFNTGAYSDVNCMPSMTAMGIKWYHADSPVTAGELRDLWLPDYDSGWYMSQVVDSLAYYNVPFEWHDTTESITDQLDRGRIILTQMSEAAFDASGHCFVIYGYRRLGDSVQYMIHDPGIYDGLDSFGKPPGEAMLLDSGYVHWIIERMTFSYITIG